MYSKIGDIHVEVLLLTNILIIILNFITVFKEKGRVSYFSTVAQKGISFYYILNNIIHLLTGRISVCNYIL